MSVCKTVGFLSLNRTSELVWDSEREEAGASSDSIIYLDDRILCIFRQLLKCLCFSYSFLDGVRIYHVEILETPIVKNILEMKTHVGILGQHSAKTGLSRLVTVSHVNSESCEVLRKYDTCVCSKMLFLSIIN